MARRKATLLSETSRAGLGGLLLFAQESHYWLTGYDSFGFCFFQCHYLGADGRVALLTRSADLRQAQRTSDISDIRIWRDAEDADPTLDLRRMLESLDAKGPLGVEFESYGLPHAAGRRLEAALRGFADLVDVSALVPRLRATKSGEEIVYVQEAARLSDLADQAAITRTCAGADEGDILADMHAAIFSAGGDYPGNEFIIGSGSDALLCRYKSGRRKLDADDQLTIEFAGVSRHYHAAIMRTHIVGRARLEHLRFHAVARDALLACESELRPGRAAGDVFAAHARIFDSAGLTSARLNACGYSLGAKFTPSWMDPPMFYEANSYTIQANQVYFLHMILMDSRSDTAMCLGRTSLVGARGAEPLNARNLDLVQK